MGKLVHTRHILKKKFPNRQSLTITFRRKPKNIEGFCFFLFSYVLCNQIWLNCFLADHHFEYITKSLKETLWGEEGLID
jgi:hypothetical protein